MAVVGVGLIGGSIGLAVRERGLARQVIGIGRRTASLQQAVERRAIDRFATDLAAGVTEAELVIVCSPVETIPTLVVDIANHCPPQAIITDVGSTKQAIVTDVARQLSSHRATFIGSHPLAGSEKTGVAHARAELFDGRTVVLTPTADTPAAACDRLQSFWSGLGARVVRMSPADHDAALAATSHLPHVIAALLAAVTPAEYLALTATGWLDTTRIAAGDIELWQQILRQNRASVLQCLDQFAKVLTSFTQALQRQDDAVVAELLALGKQRRDALAD